MTMMWMITSFLIMLLMALFFLLSKKEKWEKDGSLSFECGFTSYFFSRFSFSIHYFLVSLLFLFLDLELCFMMPFFNQPVVTESFKMNLFMVLTIMLMSLLLEWKEGNLEWKF